MNVNSTFRGALSATLLLAILLCLSHAKAANSDYAEGMALYGQKNYRAAAAKFEAAMRTTHDANVVYYCALANQMSNNRARARQLYEYVGSAYPSSRAAGMAAEALKQFGGAPASSGASSSTAIASGSGSGAAAAPSRRSINGYSGPDVVRVPFTRGRGGGVYVDMDINGHSIQCHLDTGAGVTMIGANKMEELGIARPASGDKFETSGVGERQHLQAWTQKADLKLGQIYRRDFPLTVQDHFDGDPLLGQDFMSDVDTQIDEANHVVVFRRRGSHAVTASHRGSIDVPFTLEGRHMIVEGLVNNKPYKFYFDTGADSIAFSPRDMKKLNIEIPSDARQGMSSGVAGSTLTYIFNVERVKVGGIVKDDCQISVVENSAMEHPLLGQAFFAGYNVDIDNAAKVIHFTSSN